MAYSTFGARAGVLLAVLACACGGSSHSSGPDRGAGPANGGAGSSASAGSGSNATAGANGLAGSNGHSSSSAGQAGSGAGTTESGGTCPPITPCGGDLVGDWTIQDYCLGQLKLSFGASCPEATFSIGQLKAVGTLSFKADGTESANAVISYQGALHIPTNCFDEASCSAYQTSLNATAGITGASCTWDTVTGCSCTMSVSGSSMGSGTYQVQGTNVTYVNADTGSSSVTSFCVTGNTLRLHSGGDGKPVNSMTLTR